MARAWVSDRWVKDATVELPDGTKTKISPTPAQLKSMKTLPEHFRTAKFGKGSRWVAGWYDPENSQRQKLFTRRTDAEAFVAELEDDIRSDRYIDPSARARTFSDVAETWLASKNRIKESTYFTYRARLDMYVLPQWGDRAIGSIKREQINEWIAELRAGTAKHVFDPTGYLKHKQPRDPAKMSASYLRSVVSVAFGGPLRYALSEGWIGRDPSRGVELPRDHGDIENDLPSLTYREINTLASAASALTGSEHDEVLVQLLSASGPRIGEATALKIKDLQLGQKQARVRRTWTLDKNGRRILGPVKTWEKRNLPLTEYVVDGLVRITKDRDPEEFVFLSKEGAAIDSKNWRNRVWEKIKKTTKLAAGYSPHDLRHVAATNAIAAGADPKLVQRMLGHKKASETLDTYSHLWPDRVDEVMKKIEKRRKKALDATGVAAA